jgi:hypothetical protein
VRRIIREDIRKQVGCTTLSIISANSKPYSTRIKPVYQGPRGSRVRVPLNDDTGTRNHDHGRAGHVKRYQLLSHRYRFKELFRNALQLSLFIIEIVTFCNGQ